jgi:hypothetical protein
MGLSPFSAIAANGASDDGSIPNSGGNGSGDRPNLAGPTARNPSRENLVNPGKLPAAMVEKRDAYSLFVLFFSDATVIWLSAGEGTRRP